MNCDLDRRSSEAASLLAELEAVVADPVFSRSPAQIRMLKYLVEASAAGEGAMLKSYTVAVEGLGRDEDFDSQTNTYSRVLAARLRRSLDAFYRGPGATREWRLDIPQGSYEVHLVPNCAVQTPLPEPAQLVVRLSPLLRRRLVWAGAATVAALLLAAIAYLYFSARSDAARWQTANFPRVMVQTDASGSPGGAERMDNVGRAFEGAIRQYESVRLAERVEPETQYILALAPAGTSRSEIQVDLIDHLRNRRLFSGTVALSGGTELTAQERQALERTVFALFGFSGVVTSLETRNSFSANTPFDCWLRFSNSVVTEGSAIDPELTDCAQDWYKQTPSHPLAGAIHAWMLGSATLTDPPGSRRDERLNEALRIAERAHALDPGSRLATMSLARTYGLLGDTEALRRMAAEVSQKGDLNPDIYSTMGLLLVLQNDMSGEAELDRALAFHPAPPSRYFIGKFIAAMMRDDPRAAGAALERIMAGDRSSYWTLYLRTAYLARTGDIVAARRFWSSGTANHPILRLYPHYVIGNAPAAPAVKQRLREWMGPVIDR